MANLILNSDTVVAIVGKKALVEKEGTYVTEHRVGTKTLYYLDDAGNLKLDSPYVIVNLALMTAYQQQEAVRLHNEGEYQKASNQGLTINVSPEMAEKLKGSIECEVKVETIKNKEGVDIFVARKITPKEATRATKIDFKALLNKAIITQDGTKANVSTGEIVTP